MVVQIDEEISAEISNIEEQSGSEDVVVMQIVEEISEEISNIEEQPGSEDVVLMQIVEETSSETLLPIEVAHINNIIETRSLSRFSSDDSVADPNYVPLGEITDVQPLSPSNIDWFPERDIKKSLTGQLRGNEKVIAKIGKSLKITK